MSNSTTLLDNISSSQSQKEVTANAMFDAASPTMAFGRRASTTTGLTWGYYGGCMKVSGTPTQIANGTVTLSASTTNYVEVNASGVVSTNTTAFSGGAVTPLYTIVTGASTVTSYTDWRIGGAASVSGGTGTVTSVALTMPGFLTVGGSPVTTSGTLAVTLATQSANLVFAGPSTGSAAAPTFRALVAEDLPTQPFDAMAFYPGAPTASALVTRVPVARAISFAGNFSGSYAKSSVAATASTVFDVQKNGSSVGSITFAVSASTATFTSSGGSAVTLAAGDVLSIIAPLVPDVTLANIGFALAGTR